MKRTALLLALLAPTAAFAVEGAPYTYVGAGGSVAYYESDALADTARLGGAYIKVGHMINDQFGVEGRAMRTGEDSVRVEGTSVDATVEVDHAFSVFARWNFLQGRDWAIYGLLGGTAGEVTAKAAGYSATEDETDWSIGLGVDLYGNENVAVTADAIHYQRDSDYEIFGANLGFHVKF